MTFFAAGVITENKPENQKKRQEIPTWLLGMSRSP
jgi:hypothetical protein